AKYLRQVLFDPLVVGGEAHPWPSGYPWIYVESRGGAFTPDTALRAVTHILEQKIRRYVHFSRPTRLIIYYGKAVSYNTPYRGAAPREFSDLAALAAATIWGQSSFERIYLLRALEPGLEVFKIYPTCVQCT